MRHRGDDVSLYRGASVCGVTAAHSTTTPLSRARTRTASPTRNGAAVVVPHRELDVRERHADGEVVAVKDAAHDLSRGFAGRRRRQFQMLGAKRDRHVARRLDGRWVRGRSESSRSRRGRRRRRMFAPPMNAATKRVRGWPYSSSGVPICSMRPSRMTPMRSAKPSASVLVVRHEHRGHLVLAKHARGSCWRASSRRSGSRLPNGSSIRITCGRGAIARARATRCCCPPDSSRGSRSACSTSCARSRISIARRRACSARIPRSPNITFSITVRCGKERELLEHETDVAMLGRDECRRRLRSTRPSSATRPLFGRSKPAIMRRVEVLPEPDGPNSAKISPRSIENDTPSTAGARLAAIA